MTYDPEEDLQILTYFHDRGDLEAALAKAEQIFERGISGKQRLFLVGLKGLMLVGLKRDDEAMPFLREALVLEDSSPLTRNVKLTYAILLWGKASKTIETTGRLPRRDYEELLKQTDAMLKYFPDEDTISERVGNLCLRLSDYPNAVKYYAIKIKSSGEGNDYGQLSNYATAYAGLMTMEGLKRAEYLYVRALPLAREAGDTPVIKHVESCLLAARTLQQTGGAFPKFTPGGMSLN